MLLITKDILAAGGMRQAGKLLLQRGIETPSGACTSCNKTLVSLQNIKYFSLTLTRGLQ